MAVLAAAIWLLFTTREKRAERQHCWVICACLLLPDKRREYLPQFLLTRHQPASSVQSRNIPWAQVSQMPSIAAEEILVLVLVLVEVVLISFSFFWGRVLLDNPIGCLKIHCVAQAGLKLAVFLGSSHEGWDYRWGSPHLTLIVTEAC